MSRGFIDTFRVLNHKLVQQRGITSYWILCVLSQLTGKDLKKLFHEMWKATVRESSGQDVMDKKLRGNAIKKLATSRD